MSGLPTDYVVLNDARDLLSDARDLLKSDTVDAIEGRRHLREVQHIDEAQRYIAAAKYELDQAKAALAWRRR